MGAQTSAEFGGDPSSADTATGCASSGARGGRGSQRPSGPLGARWIQEHYLVFEGQETSSYYGPLNVVALNVGHHNEHHDFPSVPWNRLPAIRRAVPEVYDALSFHRSWTRLLLRFVFDRELSLYSRMIRSERGLKAIPQGGSAAA